MRVEQLGTRLNEISGSMTRYPRQRVIVWNPRQTTPGEVASGRPACAPVELTSFCEVMKHNENVGFENGDDPTSTRMEFRFTPIDNLGTQLRRGLIDDGVIVRVLVGDGRIEESGWTVLFTGMFRGRPGEDPGTREGTSRSLTAVAYGREERYLNRVVSTEKFERGTDLGAVAHEIAWKHMNLGQDEILFGDQSFPIAHEVTQIVEEPALAALWHVLFPVGKKPRFDSYGRLVAVDFRLDKPAARIYSEGNFMLRARRAAPNEIEANNSVVVRGLNATLTKIIQDLQQLLEFETTTGFFDSSYKEEFYYSRDHTTRADDTRLVTKNRIKWSSAEWTQVDEFHGEVDIDTKFLRNARVIIFVSWLAIQLAVTTLDLIIQSGVSGNTVILTPNGPTTIAIWRSILNVASHIALALLLWAMQFIGRGRYQVWGKPFEYVFQELVSRYRLTGLAEEDVRELDLRNDFLHTIQQTDAAARERLKRELVKNEVWSQEIVDDPLLEVDDIIEASNGDRYYVVSIEREYKRGTVPIMRTTAWKVFDGHIARTVLAVTAGTEV